MREIATDTRDQEQQQQSHPPEPILQGGAAADEPDIAVTGNKCAKGESYAREEVLAPKRVVTATVEVAEKLQAMVDLGIATSRMKDFYDLWVIANDFDFDGLILAEAICNTFSRRRTPLPEHMPSGLRPEFY